VSEDPKPWERQPYDTEASWEAFRSYRDDIPPRRLIGRPHSGGSAGLQKMANEFNFRARVAAYDAYLDKARVEEREAIVRQTAKEIAAKHMLSLHTAQAVLDREMNKYLEQSKATDSPGLIKPGELIKLMDAVIKLDRLVRDQPTDITSNRLDLSKLSPKELLAFEALTLKARTEQPLEDSDDGSTSSRH
jgi:hypothetical protein